MVCQPNGTANGASAGFQSREAGSILPHLRREGSLEVLRHQQVMKGSFSLRRTGQWLLKVQGPSKDMSASVGANVEYDMCCC